MDNGVVTMNEYDFSDSIKIKTKVDGDFGPDSIIVEIEGKEVPWKEIPTKDKLEMVQIIKNLEEQYKEENTFEEELNEMEVETIEPELVDESVTKMETLRAKAHANSTPPTRPSRAIKTRPSRTIKGLTPRLAECGKIKIGNKGEVRQKKGGNGTYRLPKNLIISSLRVWLRTKTTTLSRTLL